MPALSNVDRRPSISLADSDTDEHNNGEHATDAQLRASKRSRPTAPSTRKPQTTTHLQRESSAAPSDCSPIATARCARQWALIIIG
jgi:hypothetical protein